MTTDGKIRGALIVTTVLCLTWVLWGMNKAEECKLRCHPEHCRTLPTGACWCVPSGKPAYRAGLEEGE